MDNLTLLTIVQNVHKSCIQLKTLQLVYIHFFRYKFTHSLEHLRAVLRDKNAWPVENKLDPSEIKVQLRQLKHQKEPQESQRLGVRQLKHQKEPQESQRSRTKHNSPEISAQRAYSPKSHVMRITLVLHFQSLSLSLSYIYDRTDVFVHSLYHD